MQRKIKELIERIKSYSEKKPIKIISHLDTDGITSAAIFSRALQRANIKFSKTYYYVGAGALGLIILIIILKRRITVKSPMEPNPNKIKTDKKTQSKTEVTVAVQNTAPLNSADTEKRISELQKELEQIKSEEKLVQLQRQVFKERQELNKLRSEKEFKSQDFNNNSK